MVVIATAFWVSMGATALGARQMVSDLPNRDSLGKVTEMARSSVFYDIKGRPAFTIFKEQRLEVPLDRISPHLKKAILAIEDQRFYDHRGVDFIRIVGAAVANVRQGGRAQGGSTITQQLARMSFLTSEKTYTRKVQEALLAALIEGEYSKDQILELYLNKVYFGAGLYGAEAASLGYFAKHADELSIAEAATLAGLVKAPSNYAPTTNLERATQRRNLVLQAMYEAGTIDDKTLAAEKATKVALSDGLRKDEPYGRYFKEAVRRELVSRFGEERVYEGGLKVYTTIDIDMQRAADDEVQRALTALDRRRPGNSHGSITGGACCDRSSERGSSRARRRSRFSHQQLQPRATRETSAWLGVQAVRLCGGARGRVHSRDDHRPPQRSDCDAAGRLGSGRRSLDRGRHDDACRAQDLE